MHLSHRALSHFPKRLILAAMAGLLLSGCLDEPTPVEPGQQAQVDTVGIPEEARAITPPAIPRMSYSSPNLQVCGPETELTIYAG